MELDHQVDVLLAFLGNPFEQDVGMDAASARRDADNGGPCSKSSFKQTREQFRVQSVVFLDFALNLSFLCFQTVTRSIKNCPVNIMFRWF